MTAKSRCLEALTRAGISPRGLTREQAAAYIGVSATLFDSLVASGQMPAARRINSRAVWDRIAIDDAFDRLPSDGGAESQAADIWGQARA